jgi:hypothetical protein
MCFSATISFLTAGLLFCIGVATLLKVRSKKQIFIALIPFIFALQQASEGILWLTLPSPQIYPHIITFAQYGFLTAAFLLWPIIIPSSLYMLEADSTRRRLMLICLTIGLLWALTAFYLMVTAGVHCAIVGSHILYDINESHVNRTMALLLYCCATILPFFIATRKDLKMFGVLLAISCALSYYMWYVHLTSIWCFFAAVLSLGLYWIIARDKSE